ncbi:MAG: peptidyl-prolyl cis-trans isomerase [Spirochaetaceae bacterium]|jgi:hypothetical protein|nr:peptidyl-prolyl cis-trans isomerase [Spirochaetaceae bacterium]
MKIKSILFLVFASFAYLSAQSPIADRPVAVISLHKTDVIPQSKFEQYLNILKGGDEGTEFTLDQKKEILNVMINQILVRQDASNRSIVVTQEQVKQMALQQLSMELQQAGVIPQGAVLNDYAQFVQVLESQGVNTSLYLENIESNIIIQTYITQTRKEDFDNIPNPTDREVRNYYNNNIAQFAMASYVTVEQIFFQKKDGVDIDALRTTSQQLYRSIESGSKIFDDAQLTEGDLFPNTSERSETVAIYNDPRAVQIFGQNFMDELFDNFDESNAFYLESDVGFHILRIVGAEEAGVLTLEETLSPVDNYTVRDYINELIRSEKQRALYEQLQKETIISLRDQAGEEGIRVFEDAIR